MSLQKKYLLAAFCAYISILIYFLFFGFGRPQFNGILAYRYALIPARIPLWLPKHLSIDILKLWIFALGNLLAFVPFGIFVPMLFKNHFRTYIKFIGVFLLFILSMEIIQMLTYLGSFDIEDVIVHTMGATIGFCSYKASQRMHDLTWKFAVMGLSILSLSLLAFLIAWIYNNTITPYLDFIYN
ncbi:VanZ family protein [Alkaliphilus crotonatoxidans]